MNKTYENKSVKFQFVINYHIYWNCVTTLEKNELSFNPSLLIHKILIKKFLMTGQTFVTCWPESLSFYNPLWNWKVEMRKCNTQLAFHRGGIFKSSIRLSGRFLNIFCPHRRYSILPLHSNMTAVFFKKVAYLY